MRPMSMAPRRLRQGLGTLAVAAFVAACAQPSPSPSPSSSPSRPSPSPSPSPSPALTLSVENRTTIAVSLVVNGQVVTEVAAGVTDDPVSVALPSLPWRVEARSARGQVLLSLNVGPGKPGGATGGTERIRLPCGFLTLWAGTQLEGPFWVPVSPPACG